MREVGSFVGQRFDGIFAAGEPCGIGGAQEAAENGDAAGAKNPVRGDQNRERGEELDENHSRQKAQSDAGDDAAEAQESCFAQNDSDDVTLRGAERFQDADFAGALDNGGVHGKENHEKADGHGDGDHGVDEGAEAGEIRGSHQRNEILERADFVAREKLADFLHRGGSVVGAVALDEKDGGFVMRAGHVLERGHKDEQSGAFAVFDDAGDVEIVFEDVEGLADFDFFRLGVNVVNQNVVGFFEIVAGVIDEAAGDGAEAVFINAIDDVEAIYRIELEQDGRDGLHVVEFLQFVAKADGHGRAAEGHEDGGGGGLDHDIGADAFDAFGGFGEQAAGEADDDDDEGDFDGDGDHGDQGAQGAMQHVLRDHVADHCLGSSGLGPAGDGSPESSPTRTSSVPGGCWRMKRSGAIVSFSVSFLIVISNL